MRWILFFLCKENIQKKKKEKYKENSNENKENNCSHVKKKRKNLTWSFVNPLITKGGRVFIK